MDIQHQNKRDQQALVKSEHGGSTNLSEGSNDSFDEDLKPKAGEKFQFVNEQSENWPQWSIKQNSAQTQTQVQAQTQVETKPTVIQTLLYDEQIYYCRGMSSAMRKQMRERMEAKRAEQQKNGTNQFAASLEIQPKAKKGVLDRIKGWFA